MINAIKNSKPLYPVPSQQEIGQNQGLVQKFSGHGVAKAHAIEGLSKVDSTDIQNVAASNLELNNCYYEGVLRQANRSFMCALIAAGLGLVFFFLAAFILMQSGQFSPITAIGGAVSEVVSGLFFHLHLRTTKQLESFHRNRARRPRAAEAGEE